MPQLWAWASWRFRKLQRLSDHVLCLLPFERDWLEQRGMSATFVGHPLFEKTESGAGGRPEMHAQGKPKLALLPGSRGSEVKANWPTMFAAWQALRDEYPEMTTCVAAADEQRRAQLESLLPEGSWPSEMHVVTGDASAVLDWADLTLVVSGTATLHAASRHTPMVVLYNVNRVSWQLAGRWLVATRTFSLPNLISESLGMGRVVPELVPHFGAVEPVVEVLRPLMTESDARDGQLDAFERIAQCFAGQGFAKASVDALLKQIDPAV